MPLMGLREYARHRGVTLKSVQRAIESGRIATKRDAKGKKKIESEVADRAWDENTNTAKIPAKYAEEDGISFQELPDPIDPNEERPDNEGEDEDLSEDEDTPNFFKERARKERYLARLKELEYHKKSGSLILVEEVERELFRTARIVRDSILALPAKISHQLASETDPHAISVILEKELRAAMEAISDETLSERSQDSR